MHFLFFILEQNSHLDLFIPARKRWKQHNRLGPGLLKAPNRKLPNYGPYELDATRATFDASINKEREREREGGYNFHGFDSRKSSNLDVPQVYWLTLYYIGYVWMAINNE